MLIAPSMLSSDFSRLGDEIKRMDQAGADWIHLDVMDGSFVPNITFGAPVVAAMRPYTKLPFDVHLMIHEPVRYVENFAAAGADIISFHLEAADNVWETICKIKSCGAKPAVALKPGTIAQEVFPYLKDLFMVLVMTVEPGFGGQKFMPAMMDKVLEIKEYAKKTASDLLVQIDGGVNGETIATAALAGVDVCVAGTGVFRADDAGKAIADLKACAEAKPCHH